jgi:hypothetical protein
MGIRPSGLSSIPIKHTGKLMAWKIPGTKFRCILTTLECDVRRVPRHILGVSNLKGARLICTNLIRNTPFSGLLTVIIEFLRLQKNIPINRGETFAIFNVIFVCYVQVDKVAGHICRNCTLPLNDVMTFAVERADNYIILYR